MTARVLKIRSRSDGERDALSDEAVARACAGRDPAAVSELFDRFHRPVAGYIARLIGPGPDVEDLLQATFLIIARGAASYDGRAKVSTWLLGVATNVVRHHRRSVARRARLVRAAADPTTTQSFEVDLQADAHRKLRRAQRALAELAPDMREAFVLCDLEGLSAREAGDILGTSEAAVWKRASRARRAIRRSVEGPADGGEP